MGLMHSAHKAYAYIFPPDPVEVYNPGLEDRLRHANDAVESNFREMAATYAQMKSLMSEAEADWERYSKPLAESCTGVRKELVHLAHTSPQCLDAQDRVLPRLFKKRAKTGDSADIEGCARGDLPFAMVPSACQCIAGNEAARCKDTKVDTDHILRCRHLRRRILPALHLEQLFEEDGDCNVSESASFNKSLLPSEMPGEFKLIRSELTPGLLMACTPKPLQRSSATSRRRAINFL